MKLSECKHGVLVIHFNSYEVDGDTIEQKSIGMVVGISENIKGEAIPLIQWQFGSVDKMHHNLLELYEG